MQGQLEIGFGLQYPPRMVVCYAAHVIGRSDRTTIAARGSDITASISQFCRTRIIWKPYLVSPKNKQGIELALGFVETLGKKACFLPTRVRLFGHTIREHHAAGQCRPNCYLLTWPGARILESTDGFCHPLPAFGEEADRHPCTCRHGGQFNSDFTVTVGREGPVQSSPEIVELALKHLELFR